MEVATSPKTQTSRLKAKLKKATIEQLKNRLWRAGDIDFKLKPIQKRLKVAFRSIKTFLFVCLVARQTGKSYAWFLEAIEVCLTKPNARVRYGTAFHEDLTEFIIPVAESIFEDCPDDIKPVYKTKGSKYVFPSTKAELKLVGLDVNPDGIRGNALDLVVIDEAGFVAKLSYVFSIIIFMLRHRPNLRVVMSSSAPESPDHEFWEFHDQAKIENKLFFATINDDETCTQEIKDRIAKEAGGYDSTTYRRECLCERIVDADLAIIPEWKMEYVDDWQRHPEFFGYFHKYNAMDTGVVHFTANLYAFYDFTRAKLIIEDETSIKGPKMTTDDLAKLIRDKERKLWGNPDQPDAKVKVYKRIADNNNLQLINDLSIMHSLPFMATDKDELPAMVNEVRLMVKAGRIIVNPRCKMLIGCLRGGIYNSAKSKREFAQSKVFGHYDWLAALVYLVRNLDVQTNPIPKDFGFNQFTHFVHEERNKTKAEAVWGQVAGSKTFTRKRLSA